MILLPDDKDKDIENKKVLIKLAINEKLFENMRPDTQNLKVFGKFTNFCLVYFSTSVNWKHKVYNTVILDISTETNKALAMLLLENRINNFIHISELKKLNMKEAKPRYTKKNLGGGTKTLLR